MKRILCLLLTITLFVFALTACDRQDAVSRDVSQNSSLPTETPAATPEADPLHETEMSEREKNWRGDFSYFKRHYVRYHPDPFYYLSEEEFDFQVEQLAKRVDGLSDTDIYYEFSAIVAGLSDNHTTIQPPDNVYDLIFPIGTKHYGEKLYLGSYDEGYEQFKPYLLHEIVAVNGVDIKYLQKKADSIYCPTNAWLCQRFFNTNQMLPVFVDWATGHAKDEYTLQVLDDDGRVVSLELPVIKYDPDTMVAVFPEGRERLALLEETGVAYFETERGSFVYLAFIDSTRYDRGDFYKGLMQETADLLKEHPGSKLVVDLRKHSGGDDRAAMDIKSQFPLLKGGYEPETYVITGGGSTSDAISMLQIFQEGMDAVHVGEPTGQFTSAWGFHNEHWYVMPHSGITFSVANLFVQLTTENTYYDKNGKLYEWENTVLPDVYISMDVEDVKEGKDTVIEWILEH